jgi:hypothetical protein
VIECAPTASDEVVKVATRLESVPNPSVVVPSRKFTLPVGVPDAALTVAVKVIELCARAGLLLDAKATEVGASLTEAGATVSE